jgi:hypothetical protein
MCYICREKLPPKTRYRHFCMCDCSVASDGLITRVGKRENEKCPKCSKCALWHVDASALPDGHARQKGRASACVLQ